MSVKEINYKVNVEKINNGALVKTGNRGKTFLDDVADIFNDIELFSEDISNNISKSFDNLSEGEELEVIVTIRKVKP